MDVVIIADPLLPLLVALAELGPVPVPNPMIDAQCMAGLSLLLTHLGSIHL